MIMELQSRKRFMELTVEKRLSQGNEQPTLEVVNTCILQYMFAAREVCICFQYSISLQDFVYISNKNYDNIQYVLLSIKIPENKWKAVHEKLL